MSKRLLALAAAAMGATVAVLVPAGPAGAQAYPPPQHTITVDDSTPAPGQAITVTLRTCRAGTHALFGIDLVFLGSGRVDAQGVASAVVTIPTWTAPGQHRISGACLGADLVPLLLSTLVTVEQPPAGGGPAGGAGGAGAGAGQPPADGGSATGAPTPDPAVRGQNGGGRNTGSRTMAPSLDALDGTAVPADAPVLFEETAAAAGVTEGGTGRAGALQPGAAGAAGQAPKGSAEPGTMSRIARVTLGVAAVGGVPVALALSRRPRRPAV
ncbi:MAG TPA: hypothetical protein VFI47_16500, partial [Acidimicrobiales bacterium]|nr:hypothetical protein [Acidimicrobiales bacterium]